MTSYYKKTYIAFWVLFASLSALFIYEKLLMPEQVERVHWIILGIQLVPLWLFAPFFRNPSSRTFQWFCFMLLWYFLVAVVSIFHPGMYYIGMIESTLTALLFVSAMMLGRWKMRGMDKAS